MNQIVIQIDVDGVLADFTSAFLHTAEIYYPGCSIDPPPQHDWSVIGAVDLWDRRVWQSIVDTPNWWCSLKPLVSLDIFHRIAALASLVPVYFVTNRWHNRTPANLQTTWWLREYGVPNASVICSREKGQTAYLLHTTHSIEDRLANAIDIRDNVLPSSKSYLINRLHNRGPYCPELRLDTVAQFLDVVEKGL